MQFPGKPEVDQLDVDDAVAVLHLTGCGRIAVIEKKNARVRKRTQNRGHGAGSQGADPQLRVPNEAPRMQHTGVPRRTALEGRNTASGRGIHLFPQEPAAWVYPPKSIINGKDSDRFCFKDGVIDQSFLQPPPRPGLAPTRPPMTGSRAPSAASVKNTHFSCGLNIYTLVKAQAHKPPQQRERPPQCHGTQPDTGPRNDKD